MIYYLGIFLSSVGAMYLLALVFRLLRYLYLSIVEPIFSDRAMERARKVAAINHRRHRLPVYRRSA